MPRLVAKATAVALAFAVTSASAEARHRHYLPARDNEQTRVAPAPSPAQMFYPQEIEGGVSGNLPFNNQIRKHTDPLNANGGR